MRFFLYWPEGPVDANEQWLIFQEWRSSEGNQQFYIWWDATLNKPVWAFETDDVERFPRNKTVAVPTGEWFEMITYFREGGAGVGRLIAKIKRAGQAEQTIFDETWDNDGNNGHISSYMPLKNYGADKYASMDNTSYYDSFSFWDNCDADNLPPWSDADAPPIMSGGYPSSQQDCSNDPLSVEMGLTTNENATCKYDTSDVSYASMGNTFSTTGGTSHSQDVNQACGGSTTYYVRCTDGTYPTLSSLEITVDVDSAPPPPSAAKNIVTGGNLTDQPGGTISIR